MPVLPQVHLERPFVGQLIVAPSPLQEYKFEGYALTDSRDNTGDDFARFCYSWQARRSVHDDHIIHARLSSMTPCIPHVPCECACSQCHGQVTSRQDRTPLSYGSGEDTFGRDSNVVGFTDTDSMWRISLLAFDPLDPSDTSVASVTLQVSSRCPLLYLAEGPKLGWQNTGGPLIKRCFICSLSRGKPQYFSSKIEFSYESWRYTSEV